MKEIILIKTFLKFIILLNQLRKILTEENDLTSWTDPITGTQYDWSILKKNKNKPYIINDSEIDEENFSIKYYFNIGDIHNQKCNNKVSSVTEILEYNCEKIEICEIIGRHSSTKIHLLDYNNPKLGIVLEYGDGEICETSPNEELIELPRKSRFKIFCSNNNKDTFILDLPEGKQGQQNVYQNLKFIQLQDVQNHFYQKLNQVKYYYLY